MGTTGLLSKTRVYSYDFIRIFAVLAVIMIHTCAGYVIPGDIDSADFIFGNIFDSIAQIGVPLFVMLSGALNLNEDRKLSCKNMLKSALKIYILLIIWSVLYSIFYNLLIPAVTNKAISIKDFLQAIYSGHYHLWYLFMIIGLYLITPILRLFVKKENSKLIAGYLALSIIVTFCVPFINFFINRFICDGNLLSDYIDKFELGFINEYLTYYILGWYIANIELKKKHRTYIYISGIVGLLVTILCTQLFSTPDNKIYSLFYSNGIINKLCYSVALFVFVYYLFKNKGLINTPAKVTSLSNLTFGVYLIHIIVLYAVNFVVQKLGHPLLVIFVDFVLTAVISFVIIYVISKIPILNKLVKIK